MALNRLTLLLKKKLESEKAALKFKLNLEKERLFSSIPSKMQLIVSASLIALDLITRQILKGGFTDQQTKNFIRTDITSKNILSTTSNNIDDDILSDIVVACLNGDETDLPVFPDNLNASELLDVISNTNDINNKINPNEVLNLQNQIKNAYLNSQGISLAVIAGLQSFDTEKEKNAIKDKINEEKEKIRQYQSQLQNQIVSYKYMLQHIIFVTKDLFERTLHPSPYRTKYVQRLIRNLYGLIQSEYDNIKSIVSDEFNSVKSEFEKIMNALKKTDDLLIAITFVTTLYITNRLTLKKLSKEALKEISLEKQCNIPSLEEFDVSINEIPLEITPICPIIEDDVIVPHTPFSQKLEDLSCEIELNEEIDASVNLKIDLVTHAIIQNQRKTDKLTALITKDSFVDQETVIASIGKTPIYSPVQGFVDEVSTNLIVIRDIEEPNENFLESQINLLNQKYDRLNGIKSFVKNFEISSLYPVMLSISIVDDSSTSDIFVGIKDEYKKIKKDFKKINEDYEKQVKKLAGKDNVEEHAKNETLYKIKERLDEEEEKFFKYVKLLRDKAINVSKKTRAKSNEYELFEYYSLDLGLKLNALENPSNIEKEFRDIVNEFIRKRLVIDEYKKTKLSNKINSLIKDLEKGISLGNWFNKAKQVYNTNKKIEDLKNWLSGLANENNKLEQFEKTELVNSILFLFQLYLDYDILIQKYNVLKKESTPKKETVKEGNTILLYIQDIWKEYNSLPKEISQTEDLIESLSLFSTYSITKWNEFESRLYSLADKPNCPQDINIDPYIDPNSQYGFGDIQYWLKYCSYATLASVANPATGWSTGWIVPGPILFPVIYLPFKAISTNFGFIVLGVSICGIYVSPFSLFVNLSTGFAVPFIDPTAALKREIQALKREISKGLQNLREISIRPLLEETKNNVDRTLLSIDDYKQQIADNKAKKPSRYFREPDDNAQQIVKENINYINQFAEWAQREIELQELLLTQQINLFTLQIKYKILRDALTLGTSLKGVDDALVQTEKFLNNQLDGLSKLIENVDLSLAVLPISLDPESANFGITLKNPIPIINIARELDDNINEPLLEGITNSFELKNSDLLSTNYAIKTAASAINYKKYINALSTAMTLLVKKDAFPKYENLKPTNLRWITFLYTDFVTTGAKAYGFPGNLPLPI